MIFINNIAPIEFSGILLAKLQNPLTLLSDLRLYAGFTRKAWPFLVNHIQNLS